jgi:hypothetical protein
MILVYFSKKAQKIAYLPAIFDNVIRFIMKKMALIQLCEVSLLLAFILPNP